MCCDKPLKFYSEDGSEYVFNTEERRWYKFCPAGELPLDVIAQAREAQNKAELVLSLPLI